MGRNRFSDVSLRKIAQDNCRNFFRCLPAIIFDPLSKYGYKTCFIKGKMILHFLLVLKPQLLHKVFTCSFPQERKTNIDCGRRAVMEEDIKMILVLAGQLVRTIGLIPSSFMLSSLLGDALDDVEQASGVQCDGFSSSVFNCITTMASGIALCIFNYGIAWLGYQAPTLTTIPVQNNAVQNFIIFAVIGVQVAAYPLIIVLLRFLNNK